MALSKYYAKDDWMSQFSQRVKETYWYVMREEMFKSVDPFTMGAFFDSEYDIKSERTIEYEDIDVDFLEIKKHKSLKDAIKRALSLRIWHRKEQREHKKEIDQLIAMIND